MEGPFCTRALSRVTAVRMVPSVAFKANRDAIKLSLLLLVVPNNTPLATVSWPCKQTSHMTQSPHCNCSLYGANDSVLMLLLTAACR